MAKFVVSTICLAERNTIAMSSNIDVNAKPDYIGRDRMGIASSHHGTKHMVVAELVDAASRKFRSCYPNKLG